LTISIYPASCSLAVLNNISYVVRVPMTATKTVC